VVRGTSRVNLGQVSGGPAHQRTRGIDERGAPSGVSAYSTRGGITGYMVRRDTTVMIMVFAAPAAKTP